MLHRHTGLQVRQVWERRLLLHVPHDPEGALEEQLRCPTDNQSLRPSPTIFLLSWSEICTRRRSSSGGLEKSWFELDAEVDAIPQAAPRGAKINSLQPEGSAASATSALPSVNAGLAVVFVASGAGLHAHPR